MVTTKVFEFGGVAKYNPKDGITAVWTDGVCFSTDGQPPYDFNMRGGKRYRIVIEEVHVSKTDGI